MKSILTVLSFVLLCGCIPRPRIINPSHIPSPTEMNNTTRSTPPVETPRAPNGTTLAARLNREAISVDLGYCFEIGIYLPRVTRFSSCVENWVGHSLALQGQRAPLLVTSLVTEDMGGPNASDFQVTVTRITENDESLIYQGTPNHHNTSYSPGRMVGRHYHPGYFLSLGVILIQPNGTETEWIPGYYRVDYIDVRDTRRTYSYTFSLDD